jgi:hypothetical protein
VAGRHSLEPSWRAATRLAMQQRTIGETCAELERLASLCGGFPPTSEPPDIARARALLAGAPAAG